MKHTLFERLDQFMELKGLNDNKITVQAGVAVGTLGKQRRSGKGLSYESIVKILSTYPELSPSWLLLGKGDMLIKNGVEQHTHKHINVHDQVENLMATVKRQQEKIELLISQLDYIRTQAAINQEIGRRVAQHLNIDLGKL